MSPSEYARTALTGSGTMPVFTWLIPRAVVNEVGPWDESLWVGEDTLYFLKIALASEAVLFVEDAWGYYRSGLEGSLSVQTSPRAAISALRCAEQVEQLVVNALEPTRARTYAADYYRIVAGRLFLVQPKLARKAERAVRRLGGSNKRPPLGGTAQRLLSRAIGWKATLTLVGQVKRLRAKIRT